MSTMSLPSRRALGTGLRAVPAGVVPFLLRPIRLFRTYDGENLRPDLIAGLTVAVILLPQSIAFALIAELPPAMGLYAAIVGAVIGALWGSSDQIHTGPTNAISLLVLSALLTTAEPGTPEFVIAAGMVAVMAGIFQLGLGLARLGVLVNFVSHSVIVGFSTGAGILIAIKQLRHLFRLDFPSHHLAETIHGLTLHAAETHLPTMLLGAGTIVIIMLLRRVNERWPAALISMVVASAAVATLGLDGRGVATIGQLPSNLPPVADLPLLDLDLIAQLSAGALAVGAIGLVETTAIARSISTQTGQRLDSNQEFVGQGLANVAVGLLSGYPTAGSFSRSAVNHKAGAKTPIAAIFSGLFVLIVMFTLAPLAAYLPRAALAGVLIVTAYRMIDGAEIRRIWRGARGDALIMLVTFLGTLFLHIEFAVLLGIMLSFALYIVRTSTPRVYPVVPDENFRHFVRQDTKPTCPQLAVLDILGDLYFGAVTHVEQAIHKHQVANPRQRFLLVRMHAVNHCDFSGIHMLENVVHSYRDCGGDVFMVRVRAPVMALMRSTGFYDYLGADHFLAEDTAIEYLFYKVLDPAICIYESDVRVFAECQNLPRPDYPVAIPVYPDTQPEAEREVAPTMVWQQLKDPASAPLIVDVREPREFNQGHIPQAQLKPLPSLLCDEPDLPKHQPVILACRSGRRSTRAAHWLRLQGYDNISILAGGMLAWEAADLLEAVE